MDIDPPTIPRIVRGYRLLLRLFPPRFRREAEPELMSWFAASWLSASAQGRSAQLRCLATSLLDLARAVPAEWLFPCYATGRTARLAAAEYSRAGASQMETLRQDIHYALRTLRSAPTVTLVAALTIAIGVGATTTMFSIANALLLRPPVGVTDPDRLITVHSLGQDGSSFHSFSYPDYRDLAAAGSGAASLSAYTFLPASVRTGDEPRLEAGMMVSGNYFSLLGTRPAIGRFFAPEEDEVGGPQVVVLNYSLWQRRFGGDPAILGKIITVNGQPLTVIGVAQSGFHGHIAAVDFAMWSPLTLLPVLSNRAQLTSRGSAGLEMVGRLAPGVTRPQAAGELKAAAERIGRANGLDWDRGVEVRKYLPIPAMIALPAGGFLALLVTLGGLVLLIASANVANVLLARAAARSREIGIRLALGASRMRLVRQLMTESVLLFLLGGVLGTALAFYATRGLGTFHPPLPLPVDLDFHLDLRVLLVSLGVTLAAGLGFGLLPALQATRTDLAAILREGIGTLRLGRWRLRGSMVAAQVAGTAFLLVIAGLFVRALGRAGSVEVGFDPSGIQVMAMELQVRGYQGDRSLAFAEALERRIATVPGVKSVAVTDFLPLNLGNQQTLVALDGRAPEPGLGLFETDFATISTDYFGTLDLPLKKGRGFTASDRQGAPPVAIINQTLADRLWPGEDPIGKRFRFGGDTDGAPSEIVGLAADAKYRSLGDGQIPMTYIPLAQSPGRNLIVLVRMAPGVTAPQVALRRALREVDPEMPLSQEGWYADIIGVALLPNRIAVAMAGLFGATGLTLAAVGLYGLLAYRVQCRRKEIGIRLALGATAANVRQLIVGEGVRLTLAGVLLGLVCAAGATRLLSSLLFGVSPLDPLTYGSIVLLLLLVGWFAASGPAGRASRTEPLQVLRHD